MFNTLWVYSLSTLHGNLEKGGPSGHVESFGQTLRPLNALSDSASMRQAAVARASTEEAAPAEEALSTAKNFREPATRGIPYIPIAKSLRVPIQYVATDVRGSSTKLVSCACTVA